MTKFSPLLFLLTILAIPVAFAAGIAFSDISENDWYSNSVQHLAELGIVEGYSDGTYKPNNNVNRAEMAVMMDRLLITLKEKTCIVDENLYFENDWIESVACFCSSGGELHCTGADPDPEE